MQPVVLLCNLSNVKPDQTKLYPKHRYSSSDSDASVPRRHPPPDVRVQVPLPHPVLQRPSSSPVLRRSTGSLHPHHTRPGRPPGSSTSALRTTGRGQRRRYHRWKPRHRNGVHTRSGRMAVRAHVVHGRDAHHQEKGTSDVAKVVIFNCPDFFLGCRSGARASKHKIKQTHKDVQHIRVSTHSTPQTAPHAFSIYLDILFYSHSSSWQCNTKTRR